MQDFDKLIDYKKFYLKYITSPEDSGDNQYLGFCSFHDDQKQRSFSFNSKTGQWICFAGCGQGNIFDFVEKLKGITDSKAKLKWLEHELKIKLSFSRVINKQVYLNFHKILLNNFGAIEWLQDKRGWTIETIKQYKIGIRQDRITIPIFNSKNDCVNIRLYAYNPATDKTVKMINYTKGTGNNKIRYGGIRLYPVQNLKKKKILIVEGEMDCLLMNQLGFNSITITGGAGSFKTEWLPYFKDKHIYICFDIDAAGIKGATRIAKMLENYAEWVKIVNLGSVMSEPKNADVTDYIVHYNYTAKDFTDLMLQAKLYKDIPSDVKKIRQTKHKKVELSMASHHSNAMRNIEVSALVAGKNFPPYEIPNKIKISCDCSFSREKICPFCPMFMEPKYTKTVMMDKIVDEGTMLNLINIPDNQLQNAIKKIVKVPYRCDRVKFETETYANIEEISLIPEIDFSDDENYEYVQQIAYYVGHGIGTNRVYTFQGLALPDPRTQQATQIYQEAKPTVDSIDSFKMTSEMIKELSYFQPKQEGIEGIFYAYQDRYKDLEIISGIYERIDIALAYDITLHSVLDVNFQNKHEKGWMECLLVGDSGCGKTELAKAMIRYYKVGEFITGENASIAGLIGGLSQNGKHWVLNWGKIPLNNRRALFIDEVSGMSVEDIALFSGVRSSGIAELVKIRTEKTLAKTRKIWIGNPRKIGNRTRNLMEYPYGCIAVRDLIGNLEDVRRFDFVVTAHSGEVSENIYNKKRKVKQPKMTPEQCHNLVMWAWSRKKNQVTFHQKSIDKILKYASEMGRDYYHGIPIVEGADQRLKLMRGAVSIAVLMFSTNNSGENIIVKEEHVEFFYGWLTRVYNKKSLRYKEWSERELSKKVLKNVDEVNGVISETLVEILLDTDRFNLSSLINITGFDRDIIKELLRILQRNNALKTIGTSYYTKTECFIEYLNNKKRKGVNENEQEKPF